MKRKFKIEDDKENKAQQYLNNIQQENEDNDSNSCFSSEIEEQFQKELLAKNANNAGKEALPSQKQSSSKWRDLQVRTIWTFVMIISFVIILAMGHLYSAMLVLMLLICIYHELVDLPKYKERNNYIKMFYYVSWYTFIVGIYFLYINAIKEKISYLNKYTIIHFLLYYHNFISFVFYCIGFFLFMVSLKKGYYRYQFNQYAYIHIILLIFGLLSSLVIKNIFNGLIWFLLPSSLIIINDISAYLWGRMLGKHQLTILSPKKTWEGFIGAFFSTWVCCFILTEFMLRNKFLLCPVDEITAQPFHMFSVQCNVSDIERIFYQKSLNVPLFGSVNIIIRHLHIHTLFISIFASLYAPLGGLFASGFKRAIRIKDFANTIPGHGGITDRMDCQLLMGLFTYVWLSQFLHFEDLNERKNVLNAIEGMQYEDKIQLYNYLKKSLTLK